MSTRNTTVFLVLVVAAGAWLAWTNWSGPDPAGLDPRLVSGPGVERIDGGSPLRRVVHGAKGSGMELDAGEGRVLVGPQHASYREADGVDGLQAGDGIVSRFELSEPGDPTTCPRADRLLFTDGYGDGAAPAERRSARFAVSAHELGTGSRTAALEHLGPPIDLGAEHAGDPQLLWLRDDGVALHWQVRDGALRLRLRGLAEAQPAPEVRSGASRMQFARDTEHWTATVPAVPDRSGPIRTRILVTGATVQIELLPGR